MAIALSVLQNIGLLCLGAIALILLAHHLEFPAKGLRHKLLFGLILGLISIVVVASPIQGPLGASFDTRAGPLILAGYFAGPVGGLVAALLAAAARYHVGGPWIIGGVASVFLYAAAGVAFAAICRQRGRSRQGALGFLALSVAATIAVLPAFFMGESPRNALAIIRDFWPIFLVSNMIGVTLLGLTIEFLMALVAERDRYAAALQTSAFARRAARVGVWTNDLATGKVTWDAVQHELMGVEAGGFDGTHQAFSDQVMPNDRARIEEILETAKATGSPFQMQFRIRTPAGDIRHIKSHGQFVLDDETGTPRQMIGVNIDSTRESELLAQIELNSAALDSAVCGVLITSAEVGHPIVYANNAFTAISGYAAEEIMGRNCRFLNAGLEDQPELEVIRRCLARGLPCNVTLRNRRKNGQIFWNTLNLSPIRDHNGTISHFIGVQDDVTEEIIARQIIADSRDQIEAILAAAPDAILSVDSDQQIVSFNDAAVRLFGWSSEEIIGRSIHELVPVPVRRAHVELVRNYIGDPDSAPGPMSALRIVRGRRKNGSSFPALISLARYQIGGEPMVTATAHDMSEIVEVNDELVRLSDQLRDQLEEAYRANEAKDHFLAHMSHELRTPLNAIIGFSDMLTTLGMDTLGAERAGAYIADIKRSGEHLLSLINDILDLSKLAADQVEAEIASNDACDLVNEALTTIGPDFAKGAIETTVDFKDPGMVLCDRRLALQCLLNLLSNAAKFSPEDSTVTARLYRSEGGVCFDIEDQGGGVPDDILERLGEPFLRRDDPLTSNGEGGSGLGLAVTKNLVEKQNGRLQITNRRDGGTVASIWLPSSQPVAATDGSVVSAC
ncbi:MAG: PAS domain S-box protein [Thalassobaculaceae bacterium]|nr:PAS domain S-box protein [Thalassobaculaceae bacterium]